MVCKDCRYNSCDGEHSNVVIATMFITAFIMLFINSEVVTFLPDHTTELGNSICLTQSNNNSLYDKFEDGILYCKAKPTLQKYDGIQIAIGGN